MMELLLKGGEIVTIDKKMNGCTIQCRSGLLWITQEGDTRDHVIYAGERMKIESKGRVVVSAAKASSFSIGEAHERRSDFLPIIPFVCR